MPEVCLVAALGQPLWTHFSLIAVPSADTSYSWKEISIGREGSGNTPPPRLGFTILEKGGFLYLFGGSDHDPRNDLWCLDLKKGDWKELMPHVPADQCGEEGEETHPPPRHGHAVAMPPDGLYEGKMLMFGGKGITGPLGDLWSYDFEENKWSRPPIPGDEAKATVKSYHSMVFWEREERRDLLMFGGEGEFGTTNEMYAFTFPTVDPVADLAAAEKQLAEAEEANDEDAKAAANLAILKAKNEEPMPEPETTAPWEKPLEEMDSDEKRKWIQHTEAFQRAKDDRHYASFGHWQKIVPKASPDGIVPPMSQHQATMYKAKARQPHRPHDGQVMVVWGGFSDNFLVTDVWHLDLPHQKVPMWFKQEATGPTPTQGNITASSSVDYHFQSECTYMPDADPPPLWQGQQNIVAALGQMGPSEGKKINIINYNLETKEWKRIPLLHGPSQGFVGKMLLTEDKKKFVMVGGNEDVGFPLQIHLREEVQQLQRNTQYPGFFGARQAGGMFKLSVPTELEQRERTKGRLRSMQCARPSDRDAKILAKAKKKVEDDRSLRKAEFHRSMNPPPRPETIDSCPPLTLQKLESMPQYYTFCGTFKP